MERITRANDTSKIARAKRLRRRRRSGRFTPRSRRLLPRSLQNVKCLSSPPDGDGRVWTTHLAGAPGFIRIEDERTMHVSGLPHAPDPLATTLAGRTPVGTIGIDFATRRRMRLNGISTGNAGGISVATDQV